MLRAWMIRFGGTVVLAAAATSAGAQSESRSIRVPLTGVLETYALATGTGDSASASQPLRWLSLSGALSPSVRLVGGAMSYKDRYSLDETYVEVRGGRDQWKVGRFRSAFGFSDWSENYYTGFPRLALIRSTPLGKTVRLSRLDTGFEWRGGTAEVQHQIAIIDTHSTIRQLMPGHAESLSVRSQFAQKNVMVGLNLLSGLDHFAQGETHIADVDFRWSVPHYQMRGEFLFGEASGQHPVGFYVDLLHHPARMTRTTFLGRTEAIATGTPGRGFAHLHTLGVKQILTDRFTLELTNSWSNGIEPARSRRGWALQLISFTRF